MLPNKYLFRFGILNSFILGARVSDQGIREGPTHRQVLTLSYLNKSLSYVTLTANTLLYVRLTAYTLLYVALTANNNHCSTGKYLNVIRQCGYNVQCPDAKEIHYTLTGTLIH